jgi:DNA-binding Lrp family transcriptional regulator
MIACTEHFAQKERPMDDLDRQLIGLLRANARTSVATLAKKLGVARGTVQNRLGRLERSGTIAGYTLKLRPQVDERRVAALMTIAVSGNSADNVLRTLRGDPAVQALHSTNGRWDIIAELRAETLEEFDKVLRRIRLVPEITHSETNLLLSTYKM